MLTKIQELIEAELQLERSKKREKELIQIQADPQNPDHFDQLLSSNPNSSFIWIKYMDCHVQVIINFILKLLKLIIYTTELQF